MISNTVCSCLLTFAGYNKQSWVTIQEMIFDLIISKNREKREWEKLDVQERPLLISRANCCERHLVIFTRIALLLIDKREAKTILCCLMEMLINMHVVVVVGNRTCFMKASDGICLNLKREKPVMGPSKAG